VENFRPEESLAVVKFHRVAGQWFPVWELARLLKVRREKLLELIDEGEIAPAFDLRGKGASRPCVRVPPAAVIAFLERARISTATARRRVLKILSAPSSPRCSLHAFTAHGAV
jgi:Helix-turn-helix domain